MTPTTKTRLHNTCGRGDNTTVQWRSLLALRVQKPYVVVMTVIAVELEGMSNG